MNEQLDPEAMPTWLASVLSTRHSYKSLIAGVNDDDCAVMNWASGLLVVTTDFVNANPICIELGLGDLTTIGRLVVAANLADLLGTGAEPKGLVLSVMMPRASSKADFCSIIQGAKAEADHWEVPIIGGDTKLGQSMSVCGTAFGFATSEDRLFLKYRAKAGDLLWVSGFLGSCSAAVMGLSRSIEDEPWKKWATDVLTSPRLPVAQSRALSSLNLAVGGTDVSDGLGNDLAQMCLASGVGAEVSVSEIPTAAEAQFVADQMGVPAWALAFGTGGDFQFLAAVPELATDALSNSGFKCIGKITADTSLRIKLRDGSSSPMPLGGHRDSRRISFADEIVQLVREAANHAS